MRTPIICFVTALIFLIATFNELHLSHYGTSILLLVLTVAMTAAGIWSLRTER
jgi:NhaP-type Na+/H+ and K+/H+ antiporter